jgi:hypothetical protein
MTVHQTIMDIGSYFPFMINKRYGWNVEPTKVSISESELELEKEILRDKKDTGQLEGILLMLNILMIIIRIKMGPN